MNKSFSMSIDRFADWGWISMKQMFLIQSFEYLESRKHMSQFKVKGFVISNNSAIDGSLKQPSSRNHDPKFYVNNP